MAGMKPPPSAPTRRALARAFAHTLIPIAAGYLVAHYFSLLAYNGQDLWRLANDPLGNGSDLFGGAERGIDYGVVSATGIWYVQVGALVVGHVAALVLAHDRALELYGSARAGDALAGCHAGPDGGVHLPRALAALGGAERMTPLFAHAGHWAAQLLYLAPVLAMVGAIAVGADPRARRRRRRRRGFDLARCGAPSADDVRSLEEVFVLWSAARAEANVAYDAWCACPGTPTPTPSTAPPRTGPTPPRPSSRTSRRTR